MALNLRNNFIAGLLQQKKTPQKYSSIPQGNQGATRPLNTGGYSGGSGTPKTNFIKSMTQGTSGAYGIPRPSQPRPTPQVGTPTVPSSTTPQSGTATASNAFSAMQSASNVKQPKNEYLEYLRTMFNPEQAKLAQQNINELNKRISEETARNRENMTRIRGNEQGQLESGQSYDMSEESRKSSAALADLAIAKGYSTDILNQYMDAGATLYEAEQAAAQEANKALSLEEAQTLGVPFGTTVAEARQMGIVPTSQSEGFTLSEGQRRFDAQGNLIASVGKTYKPGSGGGGGNGYGINGANLPNLALGEQDKLALATQFDNAAKEMMNILAQNPGRTPLSLNVGRDDAAMNYRQARSDLIDILARDRTGAVIGADEQKQFKRVLGVGLASSGSRENLLNNLNQASQRAGMVFSTVDPSGQWRSYLSSQYGTPTMSGGGSTGFTPGGVSYTIN